MSGENSEVFPPESVAVADNTAPGGTAGGKRQIDRGVPLRVCRHASCAGQVLTLTEAGRVCAGTPEELNGVRRGRGTQQRASDRGRLSIGLRGSERRVILQIVRSRSSRLIVGGWSISQVDPQAGIVVNGIREDGVLINHADKLDSRSNAPRAVEGNRVPGPGAQAANDVAAAPQADAITRVADWLRARSVGPDVVALDQVACGGGERLQAVAKVAREDIPLPGAGSAYGGRDCRAQQYSVSQISECMPTISRGADQVAFNQVRLRALG